MKSGIFYSDRLINFELGSYFHFLVLPLNPDNQQPLLRINDDWLTSSKAKGFQPVVFNGQLWSRVGLPAVGAVTDR